MNKEGHVLNAALLSIGLGYIIHPAGDVPTFLMIAEVSVPVILGALLPDVDTAFGKHRKTLHNLPLLAIIYAYPVYFGNLHYVWIGVATHYVLDMLGSKRGIALFYPYSKEYNLPFGVPVSSKRATAVTVAVTAFELAVIAAVVHLDLPFRIQDLSTSVSTLV
ncbi:metal-dependent hydrolase [Halorussus amylolyticus]|uniref:metal-dependent hydrolase n=1 Tax=Halorussus amylolyticus TaxID=1126242 RepID=UPI0010494146|nr:metal-dependent hydrolase [Halorussus amylolyticus]